jgi:dTDP-4-dehydrorhamnose reductase
VIKKHRPDVVINTAAMTHVDHCEQQKKECWRQNVDAVANLISACQTTDSFLIHISTDFIFDGKNGPYLEEAEPNPLSYYGESKLASEKLLQASTIKWAIVRTVLVYGVVHDMSRSNIILWVRENLRNGKSIQVVNDQWRTPTLAEDLAEGCILIANKRAQGIYNISGEELLTPYDIAVQTADFFNLDKSLIKEVDGSVFKQPAVRPAKTGFVLTKAKKQLGYSPHSFLQGLSIMQYQLEEHEH